jgi:hypothetical protein
MTVSPVELTCSSRKKLEDTIILAVNETEVISHTQDFLNFFSSDSLIDIELPADIPVDLCVFGENLLVLSFSTGLIRVYSYSSTREASILRLTNSGASFDLIKEFDLSAANGSTRALGILSESRITALLDDGELISFSWSSLLVERKVLVSGSKSHKKTECAVFMICNGLIYRRENSFICLLLQGISLEVAWKLKYQESVKNFLFVRGSLILLLDSRETVKMKIFSSGFLAGTDHQHAAKEFSFENIMSSRSSFNIHLISEDLGIFGISSETEVVLFQYCNDRLYKFYSLEVSSLIEKILVMSETQLILQLSDSINLSIVKILDHAKIFKALAHQDKWMEALEMIYGIVRGDAPFLLTSNSAQLAKAAVLEYALTGILGREVLTLVTNLVETTKSWEFFFKEVFDLFLKSAGIVTRDGISIEDLYDVVSNSIVESDSVREVIFEISPFLHHLKCNPTLLSEFLAKVSASLIDVDLATRIADETGNVLVKCVIHMRCLYDYVTPLILLISSGSKESVFGFIEAVLSEFPVHLGGRITVSDSMKVAKQQIMDVLCDKRGKLFSDLLTLSQLDLFQSIPCELLLQIDTALDRLPQGTLDRSVYYNFLLSSRSLQFHQKIIKLHLHEILHHCIINEDHGTLNFLTSNIILDSADEATKCVNLLQQHSKHHFMLTKFISLHRSILTDSAISIEESSHGILKLFLIFKSGNYQEFISEVILLLQDPTVNPIEVLKTFLDCLDHSEDFPGITAILHKLLSIDADKLETCLQLCLKGNFLHLLHHAEMQSEFPRNPSAIKIIEESFRRYSFRLKQIDQIARIGLFQNLKEFAERQAKSVFVCSLVCSECKQPLLSNERDKILCSSKSNHQARHKKCTDKFISS